MPTKDEARMVVISTVAGFARVNPDEVKEEFELKKTPLSFDDNRLAFLALSLRGYVRHFSNGKHTITAKETRKSGLTVAQLINLVAERVKP